MLKEIDVWRQGKINRQKTSDGCRRIYWGECSSTAGHKSCLFAHQHIYPNVHRVELVLTPFFPLKRLHLWACMEPILSLFHKVLERYFCTTKVEMLSKVIFWLFNFCGGGLFQCLWWDCGLFKSCCWHFAIWHQQRHLCYVKLKLFPPKRNWW